MAAIMKGIVGAAAIALISGCTAVITPPRQVDEPVSVFLLDHGRHSSLVIPENGAHARYAYGDWRWYAENDTGRLRGIAAILWPTRAGLGRQEIDIPPGGSVTSGLSIAFEHLYEIRVDAARAEALARRLLAIHQDRAAGRRFNPRFQLAFVEHPQGYFFLSQSNGKVAQWLEELGCEVSHKPLLAKWAIRQE